MSESLNLSHLKRHSAQYAVTSFSIDKSNVYLTNTAPKDAEYFRAVDVEKL